MAEQTVTWAYAARADLLDALEFLVERSPAAAAGLLQQVEEAAASLTSSPERGAHVSELESNAFRQLVVDGYRLIYTTDGHTVRVVRLIHGRRDFRDAWRNRPR